MTASTSQAQPGIARICRRVIFYFVVLASLPVRAEETLYQLEYAPAPIDNPLKGLVPYQGDVRTRFPHSLEFNYLPYSALVTNYDQFNWAPLEQMLDEIAGRGHQTVFRIFLEYPGKKGVIPEFLVNDGMKVTKWKYTETQPLPPAPIETPDYEDPRLRKSLKNFITALGHKYDCDPRVGFITAGLLGTWGEWHNYPRTELFASKVVQREVMDAYEASFKSTPVLLRYPAGSEDYHYVANAERRFGYHDDSFAWATLNTGKKGDEWFYMTSLAAAGPGAISRWKTSPIGGEIRPEAWGRVFDSEPKNKNIQNFRRCVEATHVSWLMDSGMFEKKQPDARVQRARDEVRRMGYEFYCPAVTISRIVEGKIAVILSIENRGVAPFYYDWKPEWGLLDGGQIVKSFICSGKLAGILPDGKPQIWTDIMDVGDVKHGKYTLGIRIPNPMRNGHPVRFANKSQSSETEWLHLGVVELR